MSNAMDFKKMQSLLDRAAHESTPEEEARSCAVILAKAIKAGHAKLSDPKTKDEDKDLRTAWNTAVEEIFKKQRSREPQGTTSGDWKLLRSKFDGWCKICRGEIQAGDYVYWRKGFGARHKGCLENK